MKQRDFHTGQSALGLMVRNTESMFAPRIAQWEAFGRGIKDANEIIQNRHAFNEQLEQNRINNDFKNREFGFQEKQAEEAKRQFDTQFQENQRQFNEKHALDRQNSFYTNEYQKSATDLNYWKMSEGQKEKEAKLTIKTKSISDKLAEGLENLRLVKEVIEEAPEIRGKWFGARRLLNEKTSGFTSLSDEQSKHIAKVETIIKYFMRDFYGNNTSNFKLEDMKKMVDEYFANPEQFTLKIASLASSKISKMSDEIKGYREMGVKDDLLKVYEDYITKESGFFNTHAQAKPTQEIVKVVNPDDYFGNK